MRSNGLAGLATGAQLIADLAAAFWDQRLYPLPDEEGIPTRVAPIAGLNGEGSDGTLMQPLRKTVLFHGADGAPVTYWQYLQSESLLQIADAERRKQRVSAGVVPLADLEKAASQIAPAHFERLRAEANTALTAWTGMAERLDALASRDAPPTSRVRDLLQAIARVANNYAPAEREMTPAASEPEDPIQEPPAGDEPAPAVHAARPVTRDDMLGELGRIADYFRRTEPHSPLAYTLDEAIRRARLSLPDLLAEIVADETVRGSILIKLGIQPPGPSGTKS